MTSTETDDAAKAEEKQSPTDELKALGNQEFSKKNYEAAIEHYTKAISMDPSNHVLFSNRSASSMGLYEQEPVKNSAQATAYVTAARDDAKECIRLQPQFLKGYYRLAVALIAMREFDVATQTLRQGLQIEPQNSQLMKQLQNIKQLKQQQQTAQETAASTAQSAAMPHQPQLDDATAKELRELQSTYRQTIQQMQILQAKSQSAQRQMQICDLTIREVSSLKQQQEEEKNESTRSVYSSIGKAFVRNSSLESTLVGLEEEKSGYDKVLSDCQQKLQYLQQRATSQQENIQEIIKQ